MRSKQREGADEGRPGGKFDCVTGPGGIQSSLEISASRKVNRRGTSRPRHQGTKGSDKGQ